MNITKSAKLMVGAVAIVGAAGALGGSAFAGSAFTGTGVTTSGTAASAQFVGGTVSQSVTGATLSSIVYTYADTTNTAVNQATLTFADSATDGKTPTVAFSAGTPVGFSCTAIESTGHTSTCTPTGANQSGATGIAVTVPTA